MPPEPNPESPKGTPKELQSDALRHWRHLKGNEHFEFFLSEATAKLLTPAHEGALDEGVTPEARTRSLARYHAIRETLGFVLTQEKTLTEILEGRRK